MGCAKNHRLGKPRPGIVIPVEEKVRLDAEKKARKRKERLERRLAQSAETDPNTAGV